MRCFGLLDERKLLELIWDKDFLCCRFYGEVSDIAGKQRRSVRLPEER